MAKNDSGESDRERWDRKYAAGEGPAHFEPNVLLVENRSLLAGGRALDVACGLGGNALYLATLGYRVDALDVSRVALDRLRTEAAHRALHLNLVQADAMRWWIPPSRYDLIVVTYYLSRSLIPYVAAGLRSGGLYVQVSRNLRYRATRPDFSPDFMVEPGELARRAADAGLTVIHQADGRPGEDHVSEIIARATTTAFPPFPPG